jgi:hypothetical protein
LSKKARIVVLGEPFQPTDCSLPKRVVRLPIPMVLRHSAQKGLQITFSIIDTQHNNALPCAECRYAECRILYYIMLNVTMVSVIMLSVIMLNVVMRVVMLNVVMLSITAPYQ